jgi:hypothetical protein
MNRLLLFIGLLVLVISCRNSINERAEKRNLNLIDSVFSIKNLPEMQEFDLRKFLEIGASKWVPLDKRFKVDSLFYKTFLDKPDVLGHWNNYKDYQEFYFVGSIAYLKKKYLAISQWIGNGDECYIYLLNFGKNGRIDKFLLIAKMYKSPDDYDCMNSIFENGKIIRTNVRKSSEYSDSIIEKFNIENYSRVYYDSIVKK